MKTLLWLKLSACSSLILLVGGCGTTPKTAATNPVAPLPPAAGAASASKATKPPAVKFPLRINAGATIPYTDSAGNVWLPDQSFIDGDIYSRESSMAIENTRDAEIYRHEHFGMSRFSQKLPSGNYLVKLHFAETFEGIEGSGQRVFSFKVEEREFKDFDVWTKAGGPHRAYIETLEVAVTDGSLDITFTPNVENPELNGIEILLQD